MVFVENELIELLWVYKNYKSFKKVLFTMDKYRDVPVISADDGLLYKINYAEILYTEWYKNKSAIITVEVYKGYKISWGVGGSGILFPPNCFTINVAQLLTNKIINTNHDDALYGILADLFSVNFIKSQMISRWFDVVIETHEGMLTSMCRKHCYSDKDIPSIKKYVIESIGKCHSNN